MERIIVMNKVPTKSTVLEEYTDERIYKFVRASILSNWNYTKSYHFLLAYFNNYDRISLRIASGNSKVVIRTNEIVIKNISFIRDIQDVLRSTGFLNKEKLKYLLTDETIHE